MHSSLLLVVILNQIFISTQSREFFSKNLLHNKVTGVTSSCSSKDLKIDVRLKEPFEGSIYARGYPGECLSRGTGATTVTLEISPKECGVKIIEEKDDQHAFKLLIYVQYDKWVQQVSDEQIHVTCDLKNTKQAPVAKMFHQEPAESISGKQPPRRREPKNNILSLSHIHSSSKIQNVTSKLQQMVQKHLSGSIKPTSATTPEGSSSQKVSTTLKIIGDQQSPPKPTGGTFETFTVLGGNKSPPKPMNVPPTKFFGEWKPIPPPDSDLKVFSSKSVTVVKPKKEVGKVESTDVSCWMDIVRGKSAHGKAVKDELLVGELASLVIRVRRVSGLDTRVTSCYAHDGSNKNAEELIDENGCSVDQAIMPDLKVQMIRSTREKISYAPFNAFKFPDHESLHFRCIVKVCDGSCGSLDCRSRQSPDSSKNPGYVLIDHATKKFYEKPLVKGKVIDSIEIFNSVDVRAPGLDTEPRIMPHPLTEERAGVYCVSSTKLVASFGVLMSILFMAIFSAIFCCVREKMRRSRLRRAAANRTLPRLPRISHLPPTRFHGGYDPSKISHLSSPYHRFPH